MANKQKKRLANYAAWQSPQYTPAQFLKLSPKEQLEYLCLLGHLAASSHNTQPWRFRVDEKHFRIAVYLDRAAVLPESDPTGRQAVISVGCAVGNILAGAESLKLIPKLVTARIIKVTPAKEKAKDRYTLLTSLEFTKSRSTASGNTLKAIFDRKVVRAEFDIAKKIPASLLQKIGKITPPKDQRLLTLIKTEDRLKVSELQAQADGFVANSPLFAKELGAWILPNDTQSYVGMPGSNMGLTQAGSERLHNALLGKIKLQPEDMLKFSLGTKFMIERSNLLGFIFAQTDVPPSWLSAGIFAQRLFLLFEQNHVAVSIHAGITEVGLAHNIFMSTYKQKGKLLVVFRAGYVKRKEDLQRPHSPRLPLKQILI